jgi:hypothetical protein
MITGNMSSTKRRGIVPRCEADKRSGERCKHSGIVRAGNKWVCVRHARAIKAKEQKA